MKEITYAMTELQKVYCAGAEPGMPLGGIPAHAYFEIEAPDASPEQLITALRKLVELQNMFRAVIVQDTVVIKEKIEFEIPVYQNCTEEQRTALAEELFSTEFDMEHGALFRFALSSSEENQWRIHICHAGVIADGMSHQIILENLEDLYYGRMPEITGTFQDYAEFLQEQKQDAEYPEEKQILLERLSGYDLRPALPLIREEENCNPEHTQKEYEISWETYHALNQFAVENGVTVFALLLTLFGKVLKRYSENEKFLINIPVMMRNLPVEGIQNIAGLCSDFMLFDFDDSGKKSIGELAEENLEKLFEIASCPHCHGTDCIKELQKQSHGGLTAPVVFTSTIGTKNQKQHHFCKQATRSFTSQVWMELLLTEAEQGIHINLSYVSDLFEDNLPEAMTETLIDNLHALLSGELSWNDDIKLSRRDEAIIRNLNATEAPVSEMQINEILERNFEIYQDKILLYAPEQNLTYGQAKQQALKIISQIPADQTAGLYLPKSIRQAVCELALLYSGTTFLPIDIELPASQIQECIDRIGIGFLITSKELRRNLDSVQNVRIFCIEELEAKEIPEEFCFQKRKNEFPVIINTSGTTGVSRSVQLRNQAIVNCILDSEKQYGISQEDTCFAVTNYCHDMSLFDIIGMSLLGGSIAVPEKAEKSPDAWIALMAQSRVTVWNSVPALMQMLLLSDHGKKEQVMKTLKKIILGGDYLYPKTVAEMKSLNPSLDIYNVGGPSETTIWNISHLVSDADLKKGVIPYGKPFPNTRYYILDEKQNLCPVGIKGIMYVGGLGVSAGYIGNEAENQKKFVSYQGERVCNTGDVGFCGADGEIYICGRKDFQIKIMGKRIELGLIQKELSEIEGISQSAVIFEKEKNKLIAFYVSHPELEESEIRTALRKNLPEYMIPAKAYRISEMPLTQNGKINQKALSAMLTSLQKETVPAVQEDVSETESELLALCEEVLDEDVSTEHNFYDMGGDSLSAMKLAGKIKKHFGIPFSITDVLGNPEISDMLQLICERKQADES
ncbi:MAG: hypothetical protein E7496_07930 [Ruminococcus sp.]|nr:hypothetical protein [Ruminococcus sp.]